MFVTQQKKTTSYLIASSLIHMAILGIILVSKHSSLFNKDTAILNIVHNSIRVDIIEMPKFTIAEIKNFKQRLGAEDIIDEPHTIDKIAADDLLVKKKKVNFADLMKKLSKKNIENKVKLKVKPRAKHKGSKLGKMSGDLKKLLLAGNKLHQGTSIVGNQVGINDGLFASYLQQLPDLIRVHWTLPSYLLNRDLRCRVRVFLNSAGSVLKSEIIESSGESEFDQKALTAIERSQPFPVVTDEIKVRAANGDIVLGFPL